MTVDSAMDLFVTADQFGIDRLKKICEKEILQSINIDNAPTILQVRRRLYACVLLMMGLDTFCE